jgi:hypothetical protein
MAGWLLAGRLTGWSGSLQVTNLVQETDKLAGVLPGLGRCLLAVWEGWLALYGSLQVTNLVDGTSCT